MTHLDFNFGNALFHFRRTGGPNGFLWKHALAFAVLGFGIQLINVMVSWPVYVFSPKATVTLPSTRQR